MDQNELMEVAFPIEGSTFRNVPEPFVKRFLASLGVSVPVGNIIRREELPLAAVDSLKEPFALKAWGPGIVHKSELGAVRTGVRRSDLNECAQEILNAARRHGIDNANLYVEEMVHEGTELLFGIVAKPPFGYLAILGIGGTNAELLSDTCVRLCPLSRASIEEMIGSFRGAALLSGHRGGQAANREALANVLMALGGTGGLVDRCRSALSEFECNPILVSKSDAVVADARLILRGDRSPSDDSVSLEPPDFVPFFAPRSVAIVGASSSRKIWGNRDIARYRAAGWSENLYAVHASAKTIDGVPAYPSLEAIPGGVDYALISVTPDACIEVLRNAAGNVKAATINTIGFAEIGSNGKALQDELVQAAAECGVRFLGPNCMGLYSPRGRQPFIGPTPSMPGNVGAVFQSGTLAADTLQLAARFGLRFSTVVSAGNVANIGLGDIVQYLVRDPDTHTIGIHVEGGADTRLVQAIKDAKGRKPIVVLLPGMNETGSRVAASHTGALTGDRRGWEALSIETGTTLADTFDQFFAALLYLDRYRAVETIDDDSVLIIGRGGSAAVLATDACEKYGLKVPELSPAIQAALQSFTPVGYSVTNPLDLRPTRQVLDIVLQSRPFSDLLVNLDVAHMYLDNFSETVDRFAELNSVRFGEWATTRIALVVGNIVLAPGSDYDEIHSLIKKSGLPMFQRVDDAVAAIAAAKRFTHYQSR